MDCLARESKKSKTDLQLPIARPIETNLLPGIPCEVTRTIIFPKLLWRDSYTLLSVNRTWNYAVRSRQVYNERLRAHSSTPTFFPYHRFENAIAFYSIGERSWYKLPPVPNLNPDPYGFHTPIFCRCVSMSGKIYVLGGRIYPLSRQIKSFETSNQLFVFDVAAGGKWEQCASMKESRENFSCWIQDGKIYVFGGRRDAKTSRERRVIGGEVYDPDTNVWSPIKNTRYNGMVDKPFEGFKEDLVTYDASKDECSVQSLPPGRHYLLFNAQGRAYSMHKNVGIPFPRHVFVGDYCIYDVHGNSWTHSQSFSFNGVLPNKYLIVSLRAVLDVDDELLALAKWSYRDSHKKERGLCLLQSRGFGNENKEIAWELRDLNFTPIWPQTPIQDTLNKPSEFFTLKL